MGNASLNGREGNLGRRYRHFGMQGQNKARKNLLFVGLFRTFVRIIAYSTYARAYIMRA